MGVDIRQWIVTHKVPVESPVHPLGDLVPLRVEGVTAAWRLVPRLLKALEK